MDFGIRPLESDEWRLWRSLRLRAVEESPDSFRSTLVEESAEADDWWRDLIGATVQHPRGLLLVAEANSDPVGMLFGRLDDDTEVLEIGAMWVDPEVRRHGIGNGLVEAAIAWAGAAGAARADLWVAKGNTAAEQLYRKAGFTATGETDLLREGSDIEIIRLSALI